MGCTVGKKLGFPANDVTASRELLLDETFPSEDELDELPVNVVRGLEENVGRELY